MGLLILLLQLLLIPATYYIALSVSKPISKLSEVTQRAIEGDYTAKTDFVRNDEIGVLANNYSTMQSTILSKINAQEKSLIEREKISSRLETTIDKIGKMVENLKKQGIESDFFRPKAFFKRNGPS